MTAKEFLEQVSIQDEKVKAMRIKLRMLHEALGVKGVNYESTGAASGSRKTDAMAEAIAKVVDYENALKEEEAKLTIIRFNVEKAIQQIDNKNEREVLERWYLFFQPLEKIMKEMGYGERRIYDFKKFGIAKIVIP